MVSGNGHHAANAPFHVGGAGGDNTRRYLRYLDKLVTQADEASSEDLEQARAFARGVLASTDCKPREKLRAAALLKSLAELGAKAAVDADKMARLDSGEDTERVGHREITVSVPRVGRIGD